jgi:hypothetical protein
MFRTRRCPGRKRREVVEGLVMKLKVGYRSPTFAIKRRLPGAGIPSPANALRRELVTDRRCMAGE